MPSEPDSFRLIKEKRLKIRKRRNIFGRLVFHKYSLLLILPSLIFLLPLIYYELKFRRICSIFNEYQQKFNSKISFKRKKEIFK